MIDLTREGEVFILTMNDAENRWNTTFVREFSAALDDVDLATEASLEEDAATSGPLARPRGRRLLFGGLTSGPAPSGPAPSGPTPAAFNPMACYCQRRIDFNVPTDGA